MKHISLNNNWQFINMAANRTLQIDLPYDAMLHEKRQPKCINAYNTGYYPGGVYIYKKKMEKPEATRTIVEFEGVQGHTEVRFNGHKVAENEYGYTVFYADLSDYWQKNGENELVVYVDNSIEDVSRWYTGSGIYRDVSLLCAGDTCFSPSDVRVYAEKVGHVSEICFAASLVNDAEARKGSLCISVTDSGNEVHSRTYDVALKEGTTVFFCREEIKNLVPWSAENPKLYQVLFALYDADGKLLDSEELTTGFRVLEYSAEKGFLVNDVQTKLKGGCIHHDNGIFGANSDYLLEKRKIALMKAVGFNAIRSAHNPMNRNTLRVCDELGMYVMDETFDIWYAPKGGNYFDYSKHFSACWKSDTQAMVRNDYNHPSVIMYSIGNEIFETKFDKGIDLAGKMREAIREIDTTRPVTCSVNLYMNGIAEEKPEITDWSGMQPKRGERKLEEEFTSSKQFNVMMSQMKDIISVEVVKDYIDQNTKGVFAKMDIAGYNYGRQRYQMDETLHPDRLIVGSETVACDLDLNWKEVMACKNVIGDFIWTAIDHFGESGIGVISYEDMSYYKNYPVRTSGAGIIGINGNFTPLAYMAQIVYGVRTAPYIAVEPMEHQGEEASLTNLKYTNAIHNWEFPGCEGRKTRVFVYTDAADVELLVNDRLVEEKRRGDRCFVIFENVEYRPGTIKARTYDEEHQLIGEDLIETPDDTYAVQITPEILGRKAGNLICLNIALTDGNGREHRGSASIRIQVDGARLMALGTENPATTEDLFADHTELFEGKAMAILQVTESRRISIRIEEEEHRSDLRTCINL